MQTTISTGRRRRCGAFFDWFKDFAARRDSLLQFFWAILTFGPCIIGAIFYFYTWIRYASQGQQRPLNTFKRESTAPNSATIMPFLNILSTVPNKVNVTRIHYTNKTARYIPAEPVSTFLTKEMKNGSEVTGIFIHANLSNPAYEYFEVVVEHGGALPDYPWYRLNLIHPNRERGSPFTNQDRFNEYYYQPGHFLEIRYTPVEVNSQNFTKTEDNIFVRFKKFCGFADEVKSLSYESSVSHIPFSASVAAREGYTNQTTVIILRPQSILQFVYFTEEKTNLRDTMSNIGGLLSIAGSILVFLFGAGPMSPWGKLVEMPYFRRRVAGSLAKAYDSPDGISKGPFTGKIEDIGRFDKDMESNDVRIRLLKERMDELELVLTEYYLEGDIFQDYASERLQIKAAKRNEALARAATNAGQAAPLLSSQKRDEYQRQSVGSDNKPLMMGYGHGRKFSDPTYQEHRQGQQYQSQHYQLSPPQAPVPASQSHSPYYAGQEQPLLHGQDPYSPDMMDESESRQEDTTQRYPYIHSRNSSTSLLPQEPLQHHQPLYQVPSSSSSRGYIDNPFSPPPPGSSSVSYSQQGQGSSSQNPFSPDLSSSSLSSSGPSSPRHSARPSKQEFTKFSSIQEVPLGEIIPLSEAQAASTSVTAATTVDNTDSGLLISSTGVSGSSTRQQQQEQPQ
ncbi:hypothetical protein BGZ94_003935 [Podila epigama]|nr:hypothetical protein BGZ94_003935 [Podila epigama]